MRRRRKEKNLDLGSTEGLTGFLGALSAIDERDRAELAEQRARSERTIELLMEYGTAKFGDEWWPGNAWGWIGHTKGQELAELLEGS